MIVDCRSGKDIKAEFLNEFCENTEPDNVKIQNVIIESNKSVIKQFLEQGNLK